MSARYADAHPLRKLVRRIAATAPGSWVFARTLHHADRVVFRLTGGRTTLSALLSGLPVVMLTTTGAKSGRPIVSPLLGMPEGGGIVIVGSNFGRPHHPGWIHNLRAEPHARIAMSGGRAQDVVAEEVTGHERDRLLALATELYPGFPAYVRRAAPRRIRVIRLIPS
ncbi:MAG TPA: nitroreductase/quinone reductase family protein [Solirubrobacteraceae bacterium]|nr:nitroreductase/quinone reductase family protein [Solirubrobacteraceae bacterium]